MRKYNCLYNGLGTPFWNSLKVISREFLKVVSNSLISLTSYSINAPNNPTWTLPTQRNVNDSTGAPMA